MLTGGIARHAALLAFALLIAAMPASAHETIEAFDRRILAELEAKSPEAVDAWRRANAARESGDQATASKLYAS